MNSRAPFNILVFPFRITAEGALEFAVFRRTDHGWWQGVAGGGEGEESPLSAARRESFEEASIPEESSYVVLDTRNSIPATSFSGHRWSPEVIVIPEYAFGVRFDGGDIHLSHEHSEVRWLGIEEAYETLRFESNRVALWELAVRISSLARGVKLRSALSAPVR